MCIQEERKHLAEEHKRNEAPEKGKYESVSGALLC